MKRIWGVWLLPIMHMTSYSSFLPRTGPPVAQDRGLNRQSDSDALAFLRMTTRPPSLNLTGSSKLVCFVKRDAAESTPINPLIGTAYQARNRIHFAHSISPLSADHPVHRVNPHLFPASYSPRAPSTPHPLTDTDGSSVCCNLCYTFVLLPHREAFILWMAGLRSMHRN